MPHCPADCETKVNKYSSRFSLKNYKFVLPLRISLLHGINPLTTQMSLKYQLIINNTLAN